MPHKANAARRHHIPRPKRRVTNWSEYNEALRQRGSLTVWFTDEAIAAWKAAPRTTPGGQPHYSDLAITTALTLRAVFRLPLRQTEGLIGSVLQLLGLDLPVPDYSTLSRRAQTPGAAGAAPRDRRGDPPAGRQFGPEAGWPGRMAGRETRHQQAALLAKLHIGFDAVTGRIVASILTDRDVDDASQVGPLLDQISQCGRRSGRAGGRPGRRHRRRGGQEGSDDPAGHHVKADVQLAPGAPLAGAVFLDQPFARPAQLQPGAVDQQVDRAASRRGCAGSSRLWARRLSVE